MKHITALLLFVSLFSSQLWAQEFKSPDILVDTKLDSDWSGVLVSKIRRLLRNYGQADPFRNKFQQPLTVYESEVLKYLNPSAKELLSELSTMLGMEILNGKAQVVVHGLRYDIKGFKTDLKLTDEKHDGVTVSADFAASNVRVNADKVVLSLMIPGQTTMPVISIEVLNPIVVASEESLIKFFSKINFESQDKKFKLGLEEAKFEDMAKGLLGNSSVSLDFSRVIVPNVSIKIGNKTLKFDPKKIEQLIFSKKEGIKGLLLAQFSTILAKGFGKDAFKVMNSVGFDKEHWIDTNTIMTNLKIKSFESFANREHVLATLDGDFCTKPVYGKLKNGCLDSRVTKLPKSRLTENNHADSLDTMHRIVEDGKANIVVSISEDYVNKILATTIDAGLWEKMLGSQGVVMGPNKPFIRLDEKNSKTGTLYMDLVYTPKKMERLAIGEKEVRFPLLLKVGLRISEVNKEPVFEIYVTDIDTSDDTLINGKPSLGVVSNIKKLRFKKKVLGVIREETVALKNTQVLSLQYKPLKGLDLEKVNFISDGHGRMNALILLKDPSIFEEEETN